MLAPRYGFIKSNLFNVPNVPLPEASRWTPVCQLRPFNCNKVWGLCHSLRHEHPQYTLLCQWKILAKSWNWGETPFISGWWELVSKHYYPCVLCSRVFRTNVIDSLACVTLHYLVCVLLGDLAKKPLELGFLFYIWTSSQTLEMM